MTRIVAFWPFLELVAGDAGETEMASSTAAQGPPPTRAGGQDDGSYTNSLKSTSGQFGDRVENLNLGLASHTCFDLGPAIDLHGYLFRFLFPVLPVDTFRWMLR